MYFRYIAASSCCGKTKEKPYNYFIDAPQDEFSKNGNNSPKRKFRYEKCGPNSPFYRFNIC